MLSRLQCVGARSTRRYYIASASTQLRSQRASLSLPCAATRVQAPLATRSIWLFSKKTDATQAPPPATAPRDIPAPEPVSAVPEAASSAAASDIPPTASAVPLDAGAVAEASPLVQPDTIDTLAALAPLQYGDLAALGLTGWSPSGLSTWLLELINVSAGLPWFHTIVAGTILSRLLLLPFSIKQLRNAATLAPFQPRLLELKTKLEKAYKAGDKIAVQRIAIQQHRVYEESGVGMLPMLMMPFLQLPVSLGMFFGVKRLCALPLEQLHQSGVSFLPDLTIADPYYVLPVVSAVLINLQLSVNANDMTATVDRVVAAHMINAFRVVSVVSIPLMGHFPSGLNLYILTGIAAMLAQTCVLRLDVVRRMLRIPVLPKDVDVKPVTFKESIDHLKVWVRERNQIAQESALKSRKW